MITINTNDVKRFERELKRIKQNALPYAMRSAINSAAFETRKAAQNELAQRMTLRNKWTANSIRVDRAKGREGVAKTGSIEDYLERQEFGGVSRPAKGDYKPIATSYAAGQGESVKPRTRLPRRPNRLSSISLNRGRRSGTNRKQRNKLAFIEARDAGEKFVYMDLGRTKGIFRIIGRGRNAKPKMVWDLSQKTTRTPRRPWLKPATDKAAPRMPELYAKALKFQLDRL